MFLPPCIYPFVSLTSETQFIHQLPYQTASYVSPITLSPEILPLNMTFSRHCRAMSNSFAVLKVMYTFSKILLATPLCIVLVLLGIAWLMVLSYYAAGKRRGERKKMQGR
jgi:hypothetical protein